MISIFFSLVCVLSCTLSAYVQSVDDVGGTNAVSVDHGWLNTGDKVYLHVDCNNDPKYWCVHKKGKVPGDYNSSISGTYVVKREKEKNHNSTLVNYFDQEHTMVCVNGGKFSYTELVDPYVDSVYFKVRLNAKQKDIPFNCIGLMSNKYKKRLHLARLKYRVVD